MVTGDKHLNYQALLDKNSEYEGVFYVGVKTTGVFCRPTCPARKPKLENCEFFATAQQALLASYRPCKRCRPLSHPNQVSEPVRLHSFTTLLRLLGTPFQKRVWQELLNIPYGETRSYSEIAVSVGRPAAYRAVAQANGANQLAIVVPCHRVINANGDLGGYGGGLSRKEWLLAHEKRSLLE